ncbi:MAG TPA: Ig-like domain-containing protein, partial [Pyrinomonadaceae bacterium]
MRKFLLAAALIVTASSTPSLAQGPSDAANSAQNLEELVKLARAPQQSGGLGRAVVIVKDENGNPVPGAAVKLESVWGGDNFCESWGPTGEKGAIALNPIHMGRLKLVVRPKASRRRRQRSRPAHSPIPFASRSRAGSNTRLETEERFR